MRFADRKRQAGQEEGIQQQTQLASAPGRQFYPVFAWNQRPAAFRYPDFSGSGTENRLRSLFLSQKLVNLHQIRRTPV